MNDKEIREIVCGGYHNLIWRENGEILVFGYNQYGQLVNSISHFSISSSFHPFSQNSFNSFSFQKKRDLETKKKEENQLF
jgi:alpha-tubulin suppressor-like RCC1 family protein